jgi:hypothetical protein
MKKEVVVNGLTVQLKNRNGNEYISLTDIAKFRNKSQCDDIIKNWLRNRNTIELLGLWEQIYNPHFKPVEFDGFKKDSGLNSFVLTPKKRIKRTNAIGII